MLAGLAAAFLAYVLQAFATLRQVVRAGLK